MTEAAEGWFFTGRRLHRLTAELNEALCGEARPDDAEMIDRAAMNALLGTEGRSGCARCDRALHEALQGALREALNVDAIDKVTLSPEQQEIRDLLDAEQKRRAALRTAKQPPERSASVRHISAGLPTLGKR